MPREEGRSLVDDFDLLAYRDHVTDAHVVEDLVRVRVGVRVRVRVSSGVPGLHICRVHATCMPCACHVHAMCMLLVSATRLLLLQPLAAERRLAVGLRRGRRAA